MTDHIKKDYQRSYSKSLSPHKVSSNNIQKDLKKKLRRTRSEIGVNEQQESKYSLLSYYWRKFKNSFKSSETIGGNIL